MPTQLRETDVVIVGMGAAGGVAALPLAEAGLSVVGLEAGTWLDQRDFAPDEIRNNYRDWPMLVKKAEQERTHVPRYIGDHGQPSRRASYDECSGRDDSALLGPELATQSLGLQGGERDHRALWGVQDPLRLHRRGLARSDTTSWSLITTVWSAK